MILDCDPDVGKYFRHLYHIANYRCKKLLRPAWAEHVSIVRNEEPPNKEFWEAYSGQVVDIQVHLPSETNGEYVWLPVTSDYLLGIREELGLPRNPYYPLHLSVGHIHEC